MRPTRQRDKNCKTNKKMELSNNWTIGEIVTLPQEEKLLKENGMYHYLFHIGSRYVCIREAVNGQRGILLKVLGKTISDNVKIVSGEPFCRDDCEELFIGYRYRSYPFPMAHQVKEVLDVLHQEPTLLQKLEEANMHLNPNGIFWVADTTRNAFLFKIPQVYDTGTCQLRSVSDDTAYYRISVVYFFRGHLSW